MRSGLQQLSGSHSEPGARREHIICAWHESRDLQGEIGRADVSGSAGAEIEADEDPVDLVGKWALDVDEVVGERTRAFQECPVFA